ncbi:MAG TPA: FAD:protein FMN transferase [Candidatus Dormibacteraeota bacterium]|nr:FAD:protein FMN transferase [Candidatus Dormibacteraeota bacterium]
MASSPGLALAHRQALGSTVDLVVHPAAGLEAAQAVVDSVLDQLDLTASRFRWNSELSRLNRGTGTPHRVSSLLAELITVALEAARATGGLADPTVGGPLMAAGYSEDFAQMAKSQPAGNTDAIPPEWGWRRVRVQGQTVELPAGMVLDLGATAKAWGADFAAAEIATRVGGAVLVSFGGDLATAGRQPRGGWMVRVADDHHAGTLGPGQNIRLASAALATSSTTQRRWTRGGQPMHHIIDPRTGQPVDGPWRTISVAGTSCVAANTASTAAIVAGPKAPDWLSRRRLPARLVSHSGRAIHVADWPSEGDDLPSFDDAAELIPGAR